MLMQVKPGAGSVAYKASRLERVGDPPMLKIAALVWMIVGITLAGVLVVVIVTVPSLYAQGMSLIPIAAAAGFLAAIPVALVIAKKIQSLTVSRG